MNKLGLIFIMICWSVVTFIDPPRWLAVGVAVALGIYFLVITHDKDQYTPQQQKDLYIILELLVFLFIVHIAIAHGGVHFADFE